MKKLYIVVGLVALAVVALVSAHGVRNDEKNDRSFHDEMYEIMENGNYEDFEAFREENDFPGMWWIDSEADFEEMQAYHGENGSGHMGGRRGGHHGGNGHHEGCPMMG